MRSYASLLVLTLSASLAVSGCTSVANAPINAEAVKPVATATPIPPIQSPAPAESPAPVTTKADADAVIKIAAASSCATYSWKNRGRPGKGYIEGVALVYAKALCEPNRDDVQIASRAVRGDDAHDALVHYGMKPGDSLKQVYTLLIGLGMRESGGKFCCGRDMSASFSSADSAEAGLFQTSWGARRVSSALPPMLNFKGSCYLSTFKTGVGSCTANDAKSWGSGDGAKFQTLTKACPAMAANYASVLLRLLGGSKGEFGPLRTKAAEYRPECEAMLDGVKQLVQKDSAICALL